MKKLLYLCLLVSLFAMLQISCIVEQRLINVTTTDKLDASKTIIGVQSVAVKSYQVEEVLSAERLIEEVILNDNYFKIFGIENKKDVSVNILTDLNGLIEGSNKIEFTLSASGKSSQNFFVYIHRYAKQVVNNPDDSDTIKITNITMSTTSFVFDNIDIGSTITLPAPDLHPSDTTQTSLFYITSDDKIATVTNDGVVTRTGTGTVTIRIQSATNASIYIDVTVEFSIPLTNIIVPAVLGMGSAPIDLKNEITFVPANTTQTSLQYSSSNPNIATVNENGIITRVAASGSCIITVTSTVNSNISKAIPLTLHDQEVVAPTSIVINNSQNSALSGTYDAIFVTNFNDSDNLSYQSQHLVGTKTMGFFTPSIETTYRVPSSAIANWSYVEIRVKSTTVLNFWARGENADSALDGYDENCSDPFCVVRDSGGFKFDYAWNGSNGVAVNFSSNGEFYTIGYLFADGGTVYHYANGNYNNAHSYISKSGGGLKEWVGDRNYFHLGINADGGDYSATIIDYIAFYKKR